MCIGRMGSNGSQAEAIKIENTFPKLELAAILMYLMVLPWVMRPRMTPATSTFKSFSSNIISAASFATDVAVSTEMPTSAPFKANASLMPSPRNPTV